MTETEQVWIEMTTQELQIQEEIDDVQRYMPKERNLFNCLYHEQTTDLISLRVII